MSLIADADKTWPITDPLKQRIKYRMFNMNLNWSGLARETLVSRERIINWTKGRIELDNDDFTAIMVLLNLVK